MTLVDSSVWIDFYNGVGSAHTEALHRVIRSRTVLVGDLVLNEVLQGVRTDREAVAVEYELTSFPIVVITDRDIAIQAARNYRILRSKGITVRSTIDTLIATRCIHEGWSLLHRDRDYEPFVTHLGLRPELRLS